MNKTKLLKRASFVAMTAMLPFSQVATAGEVNISGWVNEEMFAYDDGNSSDIIAAEANGITLGTRLQFAGTQELPNSGLTAGFEFSVEPGGLTPLLSITQANGGDNNTAFTSVNLLSSSINLSGGFR